MSIKRFCDCCDAEITQTNGIQGAPESKTRNLRIVLMPATLGGKTTGDWCKYCIIDTINTMDDRPRSL